MPNETDCVLCRDLDPTERQKMRANLTLWNLVDKIMLSEPICEQCFGAWVDAQGGPSDSQVQEMRKRFQNSKKLKQKQKMERPDKQKSSKAASDARPDRTSALRRMTELRRVRDSRLRAAKDILLP